MSNLPNWLDYNAPQWATLDPTVPGHAKFIVEYFTLKTNQDTYTWDEIDAAMTTVLPLIEDETNWMQAPPH